MALAVYRLLEDVQAAEHLKESAARLAADGRPELAERQLRLWDVLMAILDQSALVLKGCRLRHARYAELLRLVILANDIASIPEGLERSDCRRCGPYPRGGTEGSLPVRGSAGRFPALSQLPLCVQRWGTPGVDRARPAAERYAGGRCRAGTLPCRRRNERRFGAIVHQLCRGRSGGRAKARLCDCHGDTVHFAGGPCLHPVQPAADLDGKRRAARLCAGRTAMAAEYAAFRQR